MATMDELARKLDGISGQVSSLDMKFELHAQKEGNRLDGIEERHDKLDAAKASLRGVLIKVAATVVAALILIGLGHLAPKWFSQSANAAPGK